MIQLMTLSSLPINQKWKLVYKATQDDFADSVFGGYTKIRIISHV